MILDWNFMFGLFQLPFDPIMFIWELLACVTVNMMHRRSSRCEQTASSPPLHDMQWWVEGRRWRGRTGGKKRWEVDESVRGRWREGRRGCRGMLGWQHCLRCYCWCNRLTSQLCHLHHVYSYLSVLSLCPSLPIREGAAEAQAMRTERKRDREVLLKQNTKRSGEWQGQCVGKGPRLLGPSGCSLYIAGKILNIVKFYFYVP